MSARRSKSLSTAEQPRWALLERGMELRHLQYFLAVIASGSFSRASTVLGITQPALSRAIHQLEDIVGTRLFYRHGRGARLTEKGVQFQSAVEPALRHILEARDVLKSSVNVPTGSISIGMPPSLSAVIGSRLVKVFLDCYPRVKLQLVDAFSGYLNEWLASARLDMAVINGARRSLHVRMDPLLSVDLFHVARRDLVDASEHNETTIPFKRLLTSPLILPGRHHGLRRQLDRAARDCGGNLNVILEVDALQALKDLVRLGVASTVLPHGAIIQDFADTQLVVRRLVAPDITMQFMIAYSSERQTTLAMRELARVLRLEVRRALSEGRLIGRM